MKKLEITGATLTSLICLYLSSGEAAASAVNNTDAGQIIPDIQNEYIDSRACDEAIEIIRRIKTEPKEDTQSCRIYIQDNENVPKWIRTNVHSYVKNIDATFVQENSYNVIQEGEAADTNEIIDIKEVSHASEMIEDDNKTESFADKQTGVDIKEENGDKITTETFSKGLAEKNVIELELEGSVYSVAGQSAEKTVSLSDFEALRENAEAEMGRYLKRHIGASALRLLVIKLKWQNQYSYDEKVDYLIGYGAAINKSDLPNSEKNKLIDMICHVFNDDSSETEGTVAQSAINKIDDIPRVYVSKLILQGTEQILENNTSIEKILSKYRKKRLSMDDFNEAISELNTCLRSLGYPAATCYLPEQENKSNEVFINAELGRLGNLILENDSSISDDLINRLLSDVKTGEIVRTKNLETAIYNINELGEVQAAGFFRPGEKTGETDIVIRVKDTKQDNYNITVDNFGSETSGRDHYNFSGEWINKLGNGERIAISACTSNYKQRNYGFAYEQTIAKNGTKANINISSSDYELGSWYSAMGVTGRAINYGIGFTTPLWKTGTSRMGLNYGFVNRNLKDEMRAVDYVVEKHSNSVYLGINGSESMRKAAINYDYTVTAGRMTCDNAHIMGYTLRLASEGSFAKGVLGIYGRYFFDNRLDFTVGVRVQHASNILDSSEQFFLGGARGVRAYPQGEGAGDEGYLATAELTYHTGIEGLDISAFYDTGHVDYAKDHSVLGGIYLSGWGMGLTYKNDNYWARIDYAKRIGLDEHASKAAEAKDRIWLTAGIRF